MGNWLLGRKKEDPIAKLDEVVREEAVRNFAMDVVKAISVVGSGWDSFTDEERMMLKAYGQRIGSKLIMKLPSLLASSDDSLQEVLKVFASSPSKTMNLFMNTVIGALTKGGK